MAVDEELHLQKKIVVDNYFNHLHLIHLNPSFLYNYHWFLLWLVTLAT